MLRLVSALVMTLTPVAVADELRLDVGRFRLGFDRQAGAWVSLRVGGSDRDLLAPVGVGDVRIAGEAGPFPSSETWRYVKHERRDHHLRIHRRAENWLSITEFTARDGATELRRRVTFEWLGDATPKVNLLELSWPGVRLSDHPDDFYLFPGNYPVRRHPWPTADARRFRNEPGWTRNDTGMVMLHSPKARVSMLVAYEFEIDSARVFTVEKEGRLIFGHRFRTAARLKKHDRIDAGAQVVRIVEGDEAAALDALGRLADDLHCGPPADRPDWLNRCVLYEAHPCGPIDTHFRGADGFKSLTQQLASTSL